ncbi:MAG: pyridoxamine 5'-phosphate oxidase family protein [Burkholderiaceae bacterium]|nr:pyridoxamine 5'-phosphate oxidase family protein [Burkholderiaceae bacterium]
MAERSVLCWLATADDSGQPNVSPKEVFAVADDEHIVVANIASPGSAKNIHINSKVCLSFIDVFAQKGFKVYGVASDVKQGQTEYFRWVEPLRMMAGDRFPIQSIFVVRGTAVEPIIAPSYRLYPRETTEASQVQAALRTYRVKQEVSNV